MAQFVLDTFSGTNSTAITARNGETGATWTYRRGSNIYVIYNGKLDGGGANSLYTASGTPGGANYSVTANLNFKDTNNQTNGARVYVGGRLGGTNTSQGYYAGWTDIGTAQWELWKDTVGDGSITSLGTWTGDTGLAGNNRKVELRMDGSSISLYVNDVLRVGPVTDTSFSSAGVVGVVARGSNPQSGLYGVDVLDVEANDLAAGDTQAPTVPASLTLGTRTASTLPFTWAASTDSGGGSVSGYKIQVLDNADTVLSTVDVGNVLTYTITGLAGNTLRKLRVAAYDNAVPANQSAYSASVSGTTLSKTATVTVKDVNGSAQASETALRWAACTGTIGSALAVVAQGTAETTDGSGNCVLDLNSTALAAGNSITVILADDSPTARLGVLEAVTVTES
jgi:hypothetical protein